MSVYRKHNAEVSGYDQVRMDYFDIFPKMDYFAHEL